MSHLTAPPRAVRQDCHAVITRAAIILFAIGCLLLLIATILHPIPCNLKCNDDMKLYQSRLAVVVLSPILASETLQKCLRAHAGTSGAVGTALPSYGDKIYPIHSPAIYRHSVSLSSVTVGPLI